MIPMDITSLHRSFVAVLEPPAVYERHNTGKLIDVVRGPSEVQSLLILDCGVQEAISQELETNFQVQVTAVDLCQESGDAGRSHGAQEQADPSFDAVLLRPGALADPVARRGVAARAYAELRPGGRLMAMAQCEYDAGNSLQYEDFEALLVDAGFEIVSLYKERDRDNWGLFATCIRPDDNSANKRQKREISV